jgi:hypothetical protein
MLRVISSISFMNAGRVIWPRAMLRNLNSQLPVSSGEESSGMSRPRSSVINENAFAVGWSSRAWRTTYFS